MSMCPECGLPPTVTQIDDDTEKPYYECPNGHGWLDTDGPQNP